MTGSHVIQHLARTTACRRAAGSGACWPDDGAQPSRWLQAIFTDSDSDSVSESHRFGNLTCTSL